MLKTFMHNASTLTISHNVHYCDIEVDVGPQIWKCVQAYVMVIITSSSLSSVPDSTLSADAEAHKVTEYIWLHCSFVDS